MPKEQRTKRSFLLFLPVMYRQTLFIKPDYRSNRNHFLSVPFSTQIAGYDDANKAKLELKWLIIMHGG
jgi:hypothetical protein